MTLDIPAPERQRAAEICDALLAGRIGIIEAVHALTELPELRASAIAGDPALGMLDALSTETAHLAGGTALDETARAEQEAERTRMELLVRDDVIAACRTLRQRLGA